MAIGVIQGRHRPVPAGSLSPRFERVLADFDRLRRAGLPVRLGKPDSNLFRRRPEAASRLDVRDLHHVLAIDGQFADVEGMIPYDALSSATLPHGLAPAVVPQLKSITVGGAVAGVGIESSSFRFGLVHETIEEMDVLSGDGRLIRCSRQTEPDLFYGFPNSYGTLGYALRLKVRLIPAGPCVRLIHERFDDSASFFARIAAAGLAGYLEGVVFGPAEMYLSAAAFTPDAPRLSDYTWMNVYYRSIREKREDWLSAADYLWRWDTDWFWCSKNVYADRPWLRRLAGPRLLNSRTYQRVMRWSRRLPSGGGTESVIQDVCVPVARAAGFLDFLLREIRITPIWVCPFRVHERFHLYPLEPGGLYVNFGFWDVIPSNREPGYYNRLVEREMVALGGKKGLYSSVWLGRETFDALYGGTRYRELKRRYDPHGVFPDLYEKCRGRA